ncbi:GNAT family N-acetyltransferase [Gorillibacterium timonense]|uniref:GNAT family N-acetyltransferase n=1 Tax=Gorillibacterium timonense TaxID=1689269 RepID=UPI00071D9157|nr:GNAT family N-acetyltransferase [Gorillibacterium timonense]
MKIIATNEVEKRLLTDFFTVHWGSPRMVLSSGVYICDELDGFVAMSDAGSLIGLCTYTVEGDDCEIISLDSLEENKGIGTALMKRVEEEAEARGCQRVRLITTNDNVHALAFYQRRGYRLMELFPNAVEKARKIKPEIPLMADNGIPIRDELLLGKDLVLHS